LVDSGSQVDKIREGNIGSLQIGISSQIAINKSSIYLGVHYSKITNQVEISAIQGKGRYRSTIDISHIKIQAGYAFHFKKFSFIPKLELLRETNRSKRFSTNTFIAYPGQTIQDKRFLSYAIESSPEVSVGINLELSCPLVKKDSVKRFADVYLQYSEQIGKYGYGVMRYKEKTMFISPISYLQLGLGVRFYIK